MRKQWFTLICCSIYLLAGSNSLLADSSPDSLWSDLSSERASLARQSISSNKQAEAKPKPAKYRLVTLDVQQFQNISSQVPQGRLAQRSQVYISVPMPEGGFKQFSLAGNQVMSPELAAKFPEIQTFTGYATDEAGVTARFEWTPGGFHGYVTNSLGTIYIDPFTPGDTENYMVYYRRDARTDAEPFTDVFEKKKPREQNLSNRIETANKPSGTQLRTYRLAISATAEYTKFHQDRTTPATTGKTAAMASIVSAVNRITGVYERDVAVSFSLIGNNDQIVYLDPNTDPFDNNNADAAVMLAENQTNTDSVIGDVDYDVGHVFSAGSGGGVAGPGPCETGSKANGVTKSTSPINDPFWIDFVAHELGHQFSADHTFNSIIGSCGDGNRSDAVPYEPGSGTTIMAYTGICLADNIQTSSDAYFHTASIDEIINYTTGTGTGATCGAATATNNNPPTVEAGSSFTIPKSTPFSLTGSATDPDGDTGLTYTWEQFDKQNPGGPPETPVGDAPIFRSFLPVSTPTRLFPQLSDILADTATKGELLPTYARTMNFRLTVRDNKANGGAWIMMQLLSS